MLRSLTLKAVILAVLQYNAIFGSNYKMRQNHR